MLKKIILITGLFVLNNLNCMFSPDHDIRLVQELWLAGKFVERVFVNSELQTDKRYLVSGYNFRELSKKYNLEKNQQVRVCLLLLLI